MPRFSLLPVAVAAWIAATSPVQANVLATCGASSGQAHWDNVAGWFNDRVSGGTFTFTVDGKGNPNILFKDATGRIVDASADGALVHIAFTQPDRGQFGFVAVYPEDGLIETYNVFKGSDGSRRLYWTSNKTNAVQPAKVAAFSSSCS